MFKSLNLFKTTLTSILEADGTTLPINASFATTLCEAISSGECIPCTEDPMEGQGEVDFTRLTIYHNGYNEIVKVVGCDGGVPIIERGQEGTAPRRFPVGACIQFIWTSANVQCAIATVVNGGDLSDYADDCPDVTIP